MFGNMLATGYRHSREQPCAHAFRYVNGNKFSLLVCPVQTETGRETSHERSKRLFNVNYVLAALRQHAKTGGRLLVYTISL